MRPILFAAVIAIALIGLTPAAVAQYRNPLTLLARADSSVKGQETVIATYEPAPGVVENWHTHPGEVVGYVVHGVVRLERAGLPPATLAGGASFIVGAGVPHRTANTDRTAARLVMTYFVEKGKSLSAPAVPPR